MAANGILDLNDAIDEEEKQLAVLRGAAERVIDTSALSPHQLRNLVTSLYGGREGESCQLPCRLYRSVSSMAPLPS